MPLLRYRSRSVDAVECKKMNSDSVLAIRAPLCRRLVILDGDYRIVSTQAGAFCLPPKLHEEVLRATCAWTYVRQNEVRVLLGESLAMRVFPLVGRGRERIGVLLEQYRVRAGDTVERRQL